MRKLSLLCLCLLAALALGACGKRGALKPPEGQEEAYTHPNPYPSPRTVVPGGGIAPPPEEETAATSGRRSTTTVTAPR